MTDEQNQAISCFACTDFERNPLSGSYRAGCAECQIRSIARGPAFFMAQQTGLIGKAYRAALDRAFAGNWRAGHEIVKERAAKLKNKEKP